MSVNTSITNALVLLVIVLLIFGAVTGLAFAGTDLFNPKTSAARANELNQATDSQAQMAAIARKAYEEQLRQEAEFRQRQHEQELAHQRELQALALKWFEIRQGVLLGATVVAVLIGGGGVGVYLGLVG